MYQKKPARENGRACKNLVGKRLKQSGMKWTVGGANSIIALRCATLSQNRFIDYWDRRAA